MSDLNSIKGSAICTRILFEKGDFMIAKFTAKDKNTDTLPKSDFSLKGNMAVTVNRTYYVEGDVDTGTSYKNSYDAVSVRGDYNLSSGSDEDIMAFLTTFTTETRASNMIEAIGRDNIVKVLESQDIDTLTEVKGIGFATAEKIVNGYLLEKDYSEAYVKLSKFGLTKNAIRQICIGFKSIDVAIKKVEDNPYVLMEISGFGFTKADNAFLSFPENKPTDKRRVVAYIKYLFQSIEDEGHTWLDARQFVAKIKSFIPDADLKYAVEHVKESKDYIVEPYGEGGFRITSSELYELENQIANELERIQNADCTMKLDKYMDSIRLTEKQNGWNYNEEQYEAIDGMVNNNIYLVQGLGGTGKTATMQGFLSSLNAAGYRFEQCALSGKAADNLSQVTGHEGMTIHRLLGAGQGENGGFAFGDKLKLHTNAVVLDELSMVNARIFLALLKAIPSGAKLIMLGDFGQLEAIGVGVMAGIIRSKVFPMTLLKKVNRQAQDSAIVTHSISVRGGHVPEGLKMDTNEPEIHGAKQDLKYIFVNNAREDMIFDKTIEEFKVAIEKYPIEDIQILCSTKTSGKVSTYELNQTAQKIYNPYQVGDDQIKLGFSDTPYFLRVGDKVINMKNNRVEYTNGENARIYNGNTGVVLSITGNTAKIRFDGIGDIVVSGDALNYIQLGYAITIHKSQGSTIKCVITAIPFHFLLNTRELAYTGMTRASDYQVIISSPRSFKRALEKTDVRSKQIMLHEFIINKFGNKQEEVA